MGGHFENDCLELNTLTRISYNELNTLEWIYYRLGYDGHSRKQSSIYFQGLLGR